MQICNRFQFSAKWTRRKKADNSQKNNNIFCKILWWRKIAATKKWHLHSFEDMMTQLVDSRNPYVKAAILWLLETKKIAEIVEWKINAQTEPHTCIRAPIHTPNRYLILKINNFLILSAPLLGSQPFSLAHFHQAIGLTPFTSPFNCGGYAFHELPPG